MLCFKVAARKKVMKILEHFSLKYCFPQTREEDCLLTEI